MSLQEIILKKKKLQTNSSGVQSLPTPITSGIQETCIHRRHPAECGDCRKIADLAELRRLTEPYRNHKLNNTAKSRKEKHSLQKDPSLVWPQYTDKKVPTNFTEIQHAIATKHKTDEILFKRDIKLSDGFSISRGMVGWVIDDNADTDVLCALKGWLNESLAATMIGNARNNQCHWVYVKKTLVSIPQYEVQKKLVKGIETLNKRVNYVISQQRDMFSDQN